MSEKFSRQTHIAHTYVCKYARVCVYIGCMLSDIDEFGCTWSKFVLGLLCIWAREKLENKFRGSRSPGDRGFLRCRSKETR